MRPMRPRRSPGGPGRGKPGGDNHGSSSVNVAQDGPRRRDWFPSAGEMVTLVADAAQKGNLILDALSDKKVRVIYSNLQIGDYQITDNVFVSYMTTDLFIRGLNDKRIYRQVLDLKRTCPEPILIVEGPNVYEHKDANVHVINGALAFIEVLNRVPVVFTSDPEESADILFMATNQMQFGLGYEVHPDDPRKRKRDLKLYQTEVLEAIPGVGPNLAKELLKKFGTLSGVFAATAEELAEVPGWEDGQPAMLAELFALKG